MFFIGDVYIYVWISSALISGGVFDFINWVVIYMLVVSEVDLQKCMFDFIINWGLVQMFIINNLHSCEFLHI